MVDCGVCLYSDSNDCEGVIDSHEIVTLGHDERCSECRGVVVAGTPIEQADWYDNGWDYDNDCEIDDADKKPPIFTCVVCAEIAEAFYCGGGGRIFGGEMWNEFSESGAFANLNTACFDRLKSPEAKAELRRRWMEWKGLNG